MRVNIAGRGDTGMPQPARHSLERNSPGDKQGRVRMPQTVDTHVRQSLAHDELMEPLRQRLRVEHSPVPCRENAVAFLPERA